MIYATLPFKITVSRKQGVAMAALDIEINQGTTFSWLILVKDINGDPLDMSGFTGADGGNVRGMIRRRYSDLTATATFDCTILDDAGVIDAISNGMCRLTTAEITALLPAATYGSCYALIYMAPADTAAIPAGSYFYDVEIEDNTGWVDRQYEGSATVTAEATKPEPA